MAIWSVWAYTELSRTDLSGYEIEEILHEAWVLRVMSVDERRGLADVVRKNPVYPLIALEDPSCVQRIEGYLRARGREN